jgi:hypothetical protein
LFERIHELRGKPEAKSYLIEMHNRFALPVACVVLMLLGVPLGVDSRRGGKSAGFVFTILLVFVYYFLSFDRHSAGASEPTAGVHRRVGREHSFCRGRNFSAVADGDRRADSERHGGVGFAICRNSRFRPGATGSNSPASRQVPAARAAEPGRAAFFRASSTSTFCASSSPCSLWC